MKKQEKKITSILIRYLILLAVAIPNLWIFYFIFTPLTVYPVYFVLNIFFNATLNGDTISVSNCFPIEIVKSCVAGAAYYLLMILNLATPNINLKKRLTILGISFASLLFLNIFRIIVLSLVFIYGSITWFDITHEVFWYLLSVVFVIAIWFSEVKAFKIKDIPLYSDLLFLKKLTKK